jgi:hypothetical protein
MTTDTIVTAYKKRRDINKRQEVTMELKRSGVFLALAAVLLVVLCDLTPAVETVNPGPDETITMAFAGDTIITRRIKQFDDPRDPRFQKMAAIIREADAAFLNL